MTVALVVLYAGMAMYEVSFGTVDNFANMTRNFAPFGIMALGMTVVIITGGIDLSIGSIMGAVAIVTGLFLSWEYPWYVAFFMGLAAGADLWRRQRFLRGLCGPLVLRGDAGHDVDCPLIRRGPLRQPDALQIRPRCTHRQGHRPGEMANGRCPGDSIPALDPAIFVAFLDHGGARIRCRLCFHFQGVGPPPFCHRRQ